jgi:hypothetical protein
VHLHLQDAAHLRRRTVQRHGPLRPPPAVPEVLRLELVVLDARRQGHGATLAAPHHAAHAVLHTTFNNTLLTPRKKNNIQTTLLDHSVHYTEITKRFALKVGSPCIHKLFFFVSFICFSYQIYTVI